MIREDEKSRLTTQLPVVIQIFSYFSTRECENIQNKAIDIYERVSFVYDT